MHSQCILQGIFKKKLSVEFSQEDTSSDGGLIFVKPIMDRFRLIERMRERIKDSRNPLMIDHPLEKMISQRMYQLMGGYEDVNDANTLRKDPLIQTLVDEKEPKDLASGPTLCRLENDISISEIHRLVELQPTFRGLRMQKSSFQIDIFGHI